MKESAAIYVTVLFLLSFLLSPAMAIHSLFQEIDKNKDGRIDREELADDMTHSAFEGADSNEDEKISEEEWRRMADIADEGKYGELFKAMDSDANKRISYPEFSRYAEKYSNIEEAFMVLDKDQDGSLSPEEITYRPLFRFFSVRF